MSTRKGTEQTVRVIRRRTRKWQSAAENSWILLAGLRGSAPLRRIPLPGTTARATASAKKRRAMSYVQSALVSSEQVLHEGRFSPVHKWAAFFLCVVAIGKFQVISMWATEIVITNRRLNYKRGWIARKTEEISLRRIEEVNLSQGIVGRLFGYDEIQIHRMGGSIILPPLGQPMLLKREL